MNKALSADEIRQITGEDSPMITYPDLQGFETIDEIFDAVNNDHFILLYQTAQNWGHWCACFIRPDGDIEFYDSYGGEPDTRIAHMKQYYSQLKGTGKYYYPHLTRLLLNTPKNVNIHFNQYQHQKFDPKIATCGKHVGWRLLHRMFNIDDYSKMFGKKEIDKKIHNLTNLFLN